ncbi:MAG: ankyrin repeat domain-containing protein [Imperialibacter sp.]|uniref:ankyrin repeat domain-containing protein n=1 Tax=Imperialibacter sp. TaxID=2038411 RepID=UPI0032F05478
MFKFISGSMLCLFFVQAAAQPEKLTKILKEDNVTDFVRYYSEPGSDTTLLHKSVRAAAYKISEFLIQKEPDINSFDENGQTPLHIAIEVENAKLVNLLINGGANPNLKTKGGLEGTPLMFASSIKDTTISKLLLDAGAKVNTIDINGDPALNWAAYYGHTDQMRLLIKAGADLSLRSKHGNVVDVVLRLWQADSVAEVLRQTSLATKIPNQAAKLVNAANSNDMEAARKILKSGGDANATDGLGIPALHLAAQKGYLEMTQLLLDNGADPNKLNRVGQPPLALAARFGHKDMAKLLLDNGANPNATDQHYRLTSLIGAAVNGDASLGQMLIDAGANIDHTDSVNHCAALHWSLFYSHNEFATMMISAGADYEMKVLDDRYTAYTLAKFYGNEEIMDLIQAKRNQLNPLLGSWKFKEIHYIYKDTTYSVPEAYPGTFVVAPNRYAIMYNPSDEPRKPFQSLAKPTDAEIKAAFQSIVFNSGSYELSSAMIVTTSDIARVPGFEGGKQYYEYKFEDDALHLKMVDETYPDGTKPAWYQKLEVLFILTKE